MKTLENLQKTKHEMKIFKKPDLKTVLKAGRDNLYRRNKPKIPKREEHSFAWKLIDIINGEKDNDCSRRIKR